MKKSIAILSIFLLISSISCRDENGVTDEPTTQQQEERNNDDLYSKDSTAVSTLDGGDEEIPRKDLQQWRQKP